MIVKSNILKVLAFGLVVLLVTLMITATVVEQFVGTRQVQEVIYTSPWTICLWALMVVTALAYLWQRRVHRNLASFSIHISFVLILLGALVTHVFGKQGTVHLRQHEAPVGVFMSQGGGEVAFPFQLSLDSFQLQYYAGTFSPMDYVSVVRFQEEGTLMQTSTISMNNIGIYRHYRFYQSGYDADGEGTRLSVSYDPYGIGITYAGYLCLLFSMIGFLVSKKGTFRQLLRHPLMRGSLALSALFLMPLCGMAAGHPQTLSRQEAAAFGDLYVYYHNRICPMQTLAKDFTIKLCGTPTYKGLTSEQVLTGWFFYYDQWKEERMIVVDDETTRKLLGVEVKQASLLDFVSIDGYKLESALQESGQHPGVDRANEKFNLISMVCTGSLLQIYPCRNEGEKTCTWYSLADKLPVTLSGEQWLFIRNSMSYVAEEVARGDQESVVSLLQKIKKYQENEAVSLPSKYVFGAEKIYNQLNYNKFVAIFSVVMGLIGFVLYCRRLIRKQVQPRCRTFLVALMFLLLSYLSVQMLLRGYVSGHLPLADGFETMVFLSWCSALLTLIFSRKVYMAVPFGFLLSGLAMMVAMIGEKNPQITQLMPVLQSPLLSIHVVVIMIAYALLGFVMLNGLTAVFLRYSSGENDEQIAYLCILSRVMLYPAVFLLAAGIFVGAVWANVSWGRYWGWDPKEVWALITLLIYAFALHPASLSFFRKPMFFHWFCIWAFAAVLFTYLGVNFILGGMHSYA